MKISFLLRAHQKRFRKRDIIFKSQKTSKNAQGTIFIIKRVTHELGKTLNLTQFAGGFVFFFFPHTGDDTLPFIFVIYHYTLFVHIFEIVCGFGLSEFGCILKFGYVSYMQAMNRPKLGLQQPAETERKRNFHRYYLSIFLIPLLDISLP